MNIYKLTAKLVILTYFLLLTLNSHSQNKTTTNDTLRSHVLVKARVQKGKVLLRWAIDHPTEWQNAQQSGYLIERFMPIKKDSQLRFSRVFLTQMPLKAQPLDRWQTIAEKDDYAAIIAQSLYGSKFSINKTAAPQTPSMSDMMGATDEIALRHSFALLSADMNFEAACMAGWGFTDSTALPNQEYYYRIYLANDKSEIKVDTGVVLVNTANDNPIPHPLYFKGQFSSKIANFSWDNQIQIGEYTSYILERSEDNVQFASVTKKPIINLNNSERAMPSFMYSDTLPKNNKMYYYRLRGITCFGELSEPTATVQGIGRETLSYSPNITEAKVLNDSTVVLRWDIAKDSTLKLLSSFEVSVSDQAEGEYKPVIQNINKNARTATYTGALSSNYFVVSAVDVNGQKYASFSQLIQTIDSTPPAPPIGLMGIIDTNGIVHLKWANNTEKDIYGYHVFKSNVEGEEMSLLTGDPITTNTFTDTISQNLGNEKVYYALAALDQRFNQSGLSTVATVVRPDKTPPVSPVFKDFKLAEDKVQIFWENSSSEDIVSQRLYKKIISESGAVNQWDLIKEFNSLDSTSYTDYKVTPGSVIGYTLIAIDKNKNEGTPSVPLTIQVPIDRRNKAAVKELTAVADRKSKKILVEWVYGEKGVAEYQIYKTTGKNALSLWKVAENSTVAIIDEDINPSNIYKYAIRAVFKDGTMSLWKEVNVEF